jgi:hypothetical protein
MDPKSGNDTDIICSVILNHCADQRSTKHWSFGFSTLRELVAWNNSFQLSIEKNFGQFYDMYNSKTVDEIEKENLRNLGKIFALLLVRDIISWKILRFIRLTEQTSASRFFTATIFKEMVFLVGFETLKRRLEDP